ncbi:Peroxiredoxin-2 [Myotis davidii]|uniref:Peroxiredoxin-2 n=1 Tax=Myotis davidii TaxID=225400 RepID=L5LH86_MYODS|nr:Peroxiredoxin-2 [Myotis davidii]
MLEQRAGAVKSGGWEGRRQMAMGPHIFEPENCVLSRLVMMELIKRVAFANLPSPDFLPFKGNLAFANYILKFLWFKEGKMGKESLVRHGLRQRAHWQARPDLVDGAFQEVKLSDYRGKYVVLFFYPLDFTFVCPTEIIAFSEHAADFRKLGCEEGGLGPLNIPLLADVTRSLSHDYDVLKEEDGIAYRGLFIIDGKGVLRQVTVNDLPVGRSVDEALRLVQAFQYTDEHGLDDAAGSSPRLMRLSDERLL